MMDEYDENPLQKMCCCVVTKLNQGLRCGSGLRYFLRSDILKPRVYKDIIKTDKNMEESSRGEEKKSF